MSAVKPVYIRLLILAVILYVIGVVVSLSDIYSKVGKIEHALSHTLEGHGHKH